MSLYSLYCPILLGLPYISIYFPNFALYALYFQQFHQNKRLNPKETSKIISICKALQSLIFGVVLSKMSYKVLFLKERKFQNWKCGFHIGNSKFSYLSLTDILTTESN